MSVRTTTCILVATAILVGGAGRASTQSARRPLTARPLPGRVVDVSRRVLLQGPGYDSRGMDDLSAGAGRSRRGSNARGRARQGARRRQGRRHSEATPRVDVVATINADKTIRFSVPLRAGRLVVGVDNETGEDLESKFQRVPPGITATAFLAQAKGSEPGTPAGGLSSVPPRASVITTLHVTAGEYIVGTHASIRHITSEVVTVAGRSPS